MRLWAGSGGIQALRAVPVALGVRWSDPIVATPAVNGELRPQQQGPPHCIAEREGNESTVGEWLQRFYERKGLTGALHADERQHGC